MPHMWFECILFFPVCTNYERTESSGLLLSSRNVNICDWENFCNRDFDFTAFIDSQDSVLPLFFCSARL